MEFEFDKEIDVLLRQTARGETVFGDINANSDHLDADEISAFAENALPEKARRNYVRHLADCDRCRKNLSNLTAINAETGSEIIHAEKKNFTELAAAPIPWYRNLFAVPNLAYAMGALIVMFAGIAVFTVLQTNNSENSQVSQVTEKQIGGKGMSSDGETATQEVFSSNRMSSNTAAMNSSISTNSTMNSANLPMPSAPTMLANSNAATAVRRESNATSKDTPKEDKSIGEPAKPTETPAPISAGAPPPPSKPRENSVENDDVAADAEQPVLSQNDSAQNQMTQNQTQIMPDSRNVKRAPMPAAKMRKQDSRAEEARNDSSLKSAESTSVGGRNFNRVNNIWTDTAYRGQATKNISRGTKEYKKLDSGLRGIVENLGGTVIVVWKDKAYRIQ